MLNPFQLKSSFLQLKIGIVHFQNVKKNRIHFLRQKLKIDCHSASPCFRLQMLVELLEMSTEELCMSSSASTFENRMLMLFSENWIFIFELNQSRLGVHLENQSL